MERGRIKIAHRRPQVSTIAWFSVRTRVNKIAGDNVWKVTRRRKSLTSLNFHVYAWSFIPCVYFIYARSHGNITRQWKSTLGQMTISSYRHKIRTLYLNLLLFIEALVYVFWFPEASFPRQAGKRSIYIEFYCRSLWKLDIFGYCSQPKASAWVKTDPNATTNKIASLRTDIAEKERRIA